MAATDPRAGARLGGAILLAALSLPGLNEAHAEQAPERAQLSYKFLNYQDSQPGWERIGVHAQAVSVLLPIAGEWALEGSLTSDTVSGASPSHHSEKFRAGQMEEHRIGRDLKLSRYFSRGSLTAGVADSHESDYLSRSHFLAGSLASEDRNTTWMFGLSQANDRIDVPQVDVNNESKKVRELMFGVAQVLTPYDIVQLSLSHAEGKGYFSDPYKYRDHRPDSKYQSAVMGRWNHHFSSLRSSARLSYRYYTDSFDIHAHTVTGEYVQPLPDGWTLAPQLRLYAQSAARFYLDPDNPPFPTIRPREQLQSQDQRLSAFGGVALALKLSKQLGPDLLADARYEHYEQRSGWYPFGAGSPGIAPFRADILQLGLTWFF